MLLDVTRYPDYINKIKSSKIKRDKKKHFRKLAKQFFLDDNNKLYKKIKKNSNINYDIKIRTLIEDEIEYLLFSIPETLDILELLQKYHSADNHRGIKSLRNYISKRGYYFEGSTFLINYIIKNCDICMGKTTRNKLKRQTREIILDASKATAKC